MAKSLPTTPESFQELEFPSKGIDLSQEISAQIPGTTPVGRNVRWNEPLTMNARGGSRSGLSKYIPDFVNGTGASKIQDLDSVVIVDSSALATGGGFQPVAHTTRTHTPFWRNRGGHILGVQKKIAAFPNGSGPFTLDFDNPVVAGHDIIAAAVSFSTPVGGNTHAITSTRGTFAQSAFAATEEISLWHAKITSSGSCTINFQPSGPDGTWFASLAILEYSGMNASPVGGPATSDQPLLLLGPGDPYALGNVTVSVASSRVVAAYTSNISLPDFTASGGLLLELKIDGPSSDVVLYVFDGTYSVSTNPTVIYNGVLSQGFGGVATAYKPA